MRLLQALSLALVPCVPTGCGGGVGVDPEEALEAARAALEQGRDAEARESFAAALEALEPGPGAYVAARKGLLLAGASEEPAEELRALAREHPNEVRPADYAALARSALRRGEHEEAARVLDAGWTAHPRSDQLQPVAAELREAVRGTAGEPRALWRLGRALLDEHRRGGDPEVLDAALEAFVGSLEIESGSARVEPVDRLQANLGQGWCYLLLGLAGREDLRVAETIFDQILVGFPESAEAHVGRGVAQLATGRREEAQEALERAVAMDPASFEGWFNLGLLHTEAAAWDEGRRAFEEALELRPEHVPTLVSLARTLGELGRADRPAELLRRALELDPENPEALLQLGVLHARDKRYTEALRWLDRLVLAAPEDGNAHLQRGKVLIGLIEHQAAAAALHRACALLPESYEAHYNLGVLLANGGALGDAIAYLEKAVPHAPHEAAAQALRDTIAELRARALLEQEAAREDP